MKKKLFICLVAAMTLSACGESSDVQTSAEEDSVPATEENGSEQTGKTISDTSDEKAELSIEEQTVLDQDDIRITATGIDMDGSFMGSELQFLIENESDQNITVQARNVSVNGYMVDSSISADVASQKKNNDSLTLSADSLEECGIENIAEIEFAFHIFDSETWDDIINSDPIRIKTSCADTFVQSYDDSGDLIYEDDSVRIISKGMTDDSIFGPELKLYIENKLEQNITVQTRDTSVDGFMMEPLFSSEIAEGKRAISSITFMSSELEENELTDFDNMETSFHIFDTESWDTIVDTEPVTITL